MPSIGLQVSQLIKRALKLCLALKQDNNILNFKHTYTLKLTNTHSRNHVPWRTLSRSGSVSRLVKSHCENIYVVDIHVRQVQMKLRRADSFAQQDETPKMIIVVFPLNCLILMEQRTRSDL